MTLSKIRVLITITILNVATSFSQTPDSKKNNIQMDSLKYRNESHKLTYKKMIIPVGLITAGAISFAIPALKKMDLSTKIEVSHEQPAQTVWDNYTQYFPAVMVYGLNVSGVKGLHNFKDRTIIYTASQLISAAIVTPAKNIIAEERPDGSNRKSFPSGHAATAFSTAHFMYREYRDYNTLLSLSGYPFAIFTGVYRIINNKHWVTDVVAGAGVGILSTELAYWLYPKVSAVFNKQYRDKEQIILPYYQSRAFGLSYVLIF